MHSITGCSYCLSGHRTDLPYAPTDLTLLPTTEIYTAGVKEFIIPTDGAAGFQTTRSLYPRAEVDVRKSSSEEYNIRYEKKQKAKEKAKEGEKVGTGNLYDTHTQKQELKYLQLPLFSKNSRTS